MSRFKYFMRDYQIFRFQDGIVTSFVKAIKVTVRDYRNAKAIGETP